MARHPVRSLRVISIALVRELMGVMVLSGSKKIRVWAQYQREQLERCADGNEPAYRKCRGWRP